MGNLFEIRNLSKHYPITRGWLRRVVGHVKAVDNVSFDIRRGEVLGLVGESGCGKSTTGKAILRAIEPTAGQIFIDCDGTMVDIARATKDELRRIRPRMQMIFQDPFSSLNPRMTVAEIVGEPLLINGLASGQKLRNRVAELLEIVGLDPKYMNRYPHAFSGGQRQRIGVARALALQPEFIVADEPVSALDVSIQAQILNLLLRLKSEFELTYLFISHDLGVIEYICDRVAVMYLGRIVELADTKDLFASPRHPYVEALLASVPTLDVDAEPRVSLVVGEIADPAERPSGCAFHPRCPYRKKICEELEPPLQDVSGGTGSPHWAACHFAGELSLRGVALPETPVRPQTGTEAIDL